VMFKAILWVLAGVALLVYEFPILRGERRTQPLTPDQKIWRVLVVLTAVLVIVIGGHGLTLVLFAKKT
jgi:hypothetical protein